MKHWPCLLIALCALHAAAAPATIVQGSRPPEAERFAASELHRYLKEVFDLSSDLTSQTPPETSGAPCFLIGTAADNPALRPFLGSALPTDPQAIILKKVRLGSRDAFVISGGSPEAVLWGVYDLFQRYGVTYLLQRDVVPHRAGEFYLPDLDLVLHPVLPTRSWRLVNAHAMGPESWDLKENEEVIDQLAKLKINRVYLSFWPWQSYNDFQYRGIAKTTGISFIGWPLPIDQDTIGRDLFGPVTHFENPGLAAARTYGERYDAARRLAHGIMARAKARGMEVGLEIQPLDFPTEFGAALTEAENTPIWWLGVTPGPDQPIDDPGLMDLVAADIRSYVTAYPEADLLYVEMPEFRQWSRIAEKAWASLDQRYHIGSLDKLASYVRAARNRTTYVHGDRAEAEVRGDLAGLYFLDRVIRERHVLHRAGEADIRLVYCDVSQELSSILPKLLPPGGEALMGIDYTASRVAGQPEAIAGVPAREMPTTLSYTLADDNVGILPQLATGSIAALNRLMETNAWAGYGNRFWIIGDLDPTASYMAESAWDDRVTPAAAYAQLIRGVCGPAAIGPLSRAWELIEEATRTLDQVSLSIAFPAPGMMLKFYHEGKPMPDALAGVQEKYRLALTSARRAVDASRPSGRTFAGRFVGRLEFAVSYMEAIRLVSLAGSTDKAGHEDEAARDLAAALPPLRSAIESYAAVAEGDSDKGAIASLNDFAFRPLELQLSQVRVRLARGLAAMPATAADAMLSQARPGELMVGDYFDRIAMQAQLHRRAAASSPPDLSGLIARSLAIEIPAGVPRVKAQGDEDRSGYRVERVLVEPEAGIELPVLVLKPAGAGRRPAIVAVSKEGKFADTRPGSRLEAAARQGSVVIAADLRGTGETLPPAGRDGSRVFAPAMEAILAGRTFLGTQVYDILRVAAYTASRPDVDSSKITLVGRGGPGVAALLAAALRTDFQKVIVENSVLSYLDLSQGKMDREMAELVVPGILGKFDLPDAAAAAGKSKIWLVNPKMPDGTPASESQIRREQGPEVHVILGTPPSYAELLRHDN